MSVGEVQLELLKIAKKKHIHCFKAGNEMLGSCQFLRGERRATTLQRNANESAKSEKGDQGHQHKGAPVDVDEMQPLKPAEMWIHELGRLKVDQECLLSPSGCPTKSIINPIVPEFPWNPLRPQSHYGDGTVIFYWSHYMLRNGKINVALT